MSENPYARYPAEQHRMRGVGPERPAEEDAGGRRVSVLAVLSPILSIVCCVPGAPLLGAMFGVGAIVGIRSSRGRVIGTPPAVIGVVLGILLTVLQAAVGFGFVSALQAYERLVMPKAEAFSRAMQGADVSAIRPLLSTSAGEAVSDDEIERFARVIKGELGSYIGLPKGLLALAEGLSTSPAFSGQNQRHLQSLPPNALPVPVDFSKGQAVMMVFFDDNPFNTGKAAVTDLLLLLPGGAATPLRDSGPAAALAKQWGIPLRSAEPSAPETPKPAEGAGS